MKTKICSIFGLAAFVIAPFAWADDEGGDEAQPPSIPTPVPAVAEFARGVKFTVDGYQGGEEVQTNFPVLVRLSSTAITRFNYNDFYNKNATDLSLIDIGFVDAEGNGLAYDIDTWNPSGESLVWVNLPEMTNGTEFAMWYRSSKTGKVLNSNNVWADYTGVWHLNESGNGNIMVNGETVPVNTPIMDSSTNALDGAAQGLAASVAAGKIGGSWRISNDYARKDASILIDLVEDPAKNAKVDALGDTFCASFWTKRRDKDVKWCVAGLNRRQDGSTAGWGAQVHDDVTQLRIYGNGEKNIYANTEKMSGFNTAGQWDKIDIIWYNADGQGKMIVYRNGANKVGGDKLNPATPIVQPSGQPLVMGNFSSPTSDRAWSGELDEVRLIKGIPSAARVQADYDTVNSATFLRAASVVPNDEFTERPVVNLQVVDVGASHVQFGGVLLSLGSTEASSCVFSGKVWPTAGDEPDEWTEFASGLTGGALSGLVKGLSPATAYSYKLKVTNNADVGSDEVEGSFTTSGVGVGGTGGDVTRIGDDWIHYFRVGTDIESGETINSYTFTPPSYATSVRALVVGGGGPGGYYAGGGGGAGGYIYNAALGVTPGAEYAIGVGTGGVATATATAYGSNGGNSSFVGGSGDGAVNLVAIGGGAGGNGKLNNQTATLAGKNGGSGGGTAWAGSATGSGTADQGHDGGDVPSGQWQQNLAAGGGGAAAAGGSVEFSSGEQTKGSGVGGNGRSCDITGEKLYYAGGGGGGAKQVKNKNGIGVAGKGGNGGGGRGGQYDDTSNSQYAVAGKDGFGGGGGGGSSYNLASYGGGDGGDGIVIIRYASQGTPSTVTEPIISLQSAVCNDTTFKGDVTFRVAWGGYNDQTGKGYEDVAVKAVWGYSANALNRTNDLATGVIGIGSGAFPLKSDERTVFVRLLAVNEGGASALSSETLSFYVNHNDHAVQEVLPAASDIAISRVDGAYATVTGIVTSAGTVSSTPSNCTVRVLWGLAADSLNRSAEATFEVGAFTLNMDGLFPNTTYYWDVELQDDDGNVITAASGDSFTTLGASVVSDVTTTADQQTFTVSAPLVSLGAGTTYVMVRWSEDNGSTWSDFIIAGERTALDPLGTVKTPDYRRSSWASVKYEYVVSNECVTSAGVPNGTAWSVTQTGTINPVDTAAYTWQAVNGDWSGSWNDAAHWTSSKPDCLGYPNASGANASFANCTAANPVVVTLAGKYSVGTFVPNAVNGASDITFRGAGRASSGITAVSPVPWDNNRHVCSDTQIKFENMAVTFNNDWQIMRHAQDAGGPVAYSNILVRFSNVGLNVNNKQLKLCAPYSRLEFTDGTTATAGEVTVSGTDSVLLVDDSAVTANTYLRLGVQCLPNDGEAIVFRGEAPKLTAKTWFSPYKLTGQPAGVVFEVPVGGYAEVPFVFNHGTNTFGEPDKADGTQATHTFAVSPKSPALRSTEPIANNVLVQTTAGFYSTVLSDSVFSVPSHNGAPAGAFKWGVKDAPLAEGAELSTARQLLLDLEGNAPNGVMFLVY